MEVESMRNQLVRHGMKALLGCALLGLLAGGALGCTAVFVGKDASATGHPLVARMEDGASAVSKYLVVTPPRHVEPGETETFFNGLEWGYPEGMTESLKFFSLPDFCYEDHGEDSWDGGLWPYSAAGINSEGVVITATETEDRNDLSNAADPGTPNGVEECMIPALVLPRARTAREGVLLLGAAVEKFGSAEDPYNEGYGEIAGLAIADRDEIWYMEYAGHQWAAVRIPDDMYVVNGNIARIDGFDVEDALGERKNFMGSPGVFSFAVAQGLPGAEAGTEKNFDFAQAYGDVSDENMAKCCGIRNWWGQRWFSPSVKQEPGKARYPFLMKPDKPISVEDIMAFFRSDSYAYEKDFDFEGYRVISRKSNMESHIFEMGETDSVPWQIGVVMWLALGPARESVYLPFHGGLQASPEGYTEGTDVYDGRSASWAFRSPSALVRHNPEWQKKLQNFWIAYQEEVFAQKKNAAVTALAYWNEGNPEKAEASLSEADVKMAEKAVEVARALEAQLITALALEDEEAFDPQIDDFR
jgi:dipeptidase